MQYDDVARATSERGEIVLRKRGAVWELRVNGVFVMDTAETGSEIELARAALALADAPRDVLVGGLGLGFTAHEVLSDTRVERLVGRGACELTGKGTDVPHRAPRQA